MKLPSLKGSNYRSMNTSERKNYAKSSVNADTRPLENAIINLKQELRNMNRVQIESS